MKARSRLKQDCIHFKQVFLHNWQREDRKKAKERQIHKQGSVENLMRFLPLNFLLADNAPLLVSF